MNAPPPPQKKTKKTGFEQYDVHMKFPKASQPGVQVSSVADVSMPWKIQFQQNAHWSAEDEIVE